MSLNYDYYHIFYHVAENKSLTAAANQLFLSQSTVSRSIQNLEHELGCTLLLRSKQGISLTEEGSFLYDYVKKAFAYISYAENHLHNIQKLNSGFLRIGATELTLQYFLLSHLETFEAKYPGIHMELSFQIPKEAFQLLNSGLLDIAILTTPFSENDSIQKYPLMNFSDILIASPQYEHLKHKVLDFSQLQNEPFIVMEHGTSARLYIDEVCSSLDITYFPKYEVGSMPLIVSMVERNLGIGFVPEIFVHEKLKKGKLIQLQLKTPLPSRQICAFTSKAFPVHSVRDVFLKQLCK
ncbi:HTH-type transcriptional activator CmpR [uncultured Roseburia sp.]|uniref:LysR family transcriptional regulator n=1 Tax=Brotonthovivens ammoniilytica TaxID=2981725 RepID=A0ABT2TMK5_9FIRM|nr:LysR family transcriptional regulator [Brotonthovivens ammoniilytica]MCU6763463.1 LysR family transcriptional regulator [Brotonthovivens ammoniilytica]SCJ20164.1 HTH-type transcriptional activator CmpR [uncultured Roseburia sp.]